MREPVLHSTRNPELRQLPLNRGDEPFARSGRQAQHRDRTVRSGRRGRRRGRARCRAHRRLIRRRRTAGRAGSRGRRHAVFPLRYGRRRTACGNHRYGRRRHQQSEPPHRASPSGALPASAPASSCGALPAPPAVAVAVPGVVCALSAVASRSSVSVRSAQVGVSLAGAGGRSKTGSIGPRPAEMRRASAGSVMVGPNGRRSTKVRGRPMPLRGVTLVGDTPETLDAVNPSSRCRAEATRKGDRRDVPVQPIGWPRHPG